MPATRTRASTEQAAEVLAEEVKQVQEEVKEIVATPAPEEVPAVPEAVEEPVPSEPVVPSDDSVEHVPETNGNGNGNGNANGVDVVEEEEEEEEVVDGKRKSEVVGEGDAPDSTEVVKKQKVVEDPVEEPVVPVVSEEPVEASV